MPLTRCWKVRTKPGGKGERSRPLMTGSLRRPTGWPWMTALSPLRAALMLASSLETPSLTFQIFMVTWEITRSAWKTLWSLSNLAEFLSLITGLLSRYFRPPNDQYLIRNYDYILANGRAPSKNIYYNSNHINDIKTSVLYVNNKPNLITLDYFMNVEKQDADSNQFRWQMT